MRNERIINWQIAFLLLFDEIDSGADFMIFVREPACRRKILEIRDDYKKKGEIKFVWAKRKALLLKRTEPLALRRWKLRALGIVDWNYVHGFSFYSALNGGSCSAGRKLHYVMPRCKSSETWKADTFRCRQAWRALWRKGSSLKWYYSRTLSPLTDPQTIKASSEQNKNLKISAIR